MRLNIKHDEHVALTEEFTDYLDKKLNALAKFVSEDDTDAPIAEIEFSKPTKHSHGPFFRAEINLEVKGDLYRAVAKGESIEAALDEMMDEITRELRRTKRKKRTLLKKGGSKLKEMTQEKGLEEL
jgi:ribosomal subunit interface protein